MRNYPRAAFLPFLFGVFASVTVLAFLLLAPPSKGQPPKPEGKKPTLAYYGVSACTQCHEKPDTRFPPLLCRCSEYVIWREHDKHGLAMENLKTQRARQMGKILGIADVTQEAKCVNCHGVFPKDRERINKATFRADEGVNCCACHGQFEEWVDMHGSRLKADQWRALSRKEKEEVYGMKDLWDPVRRTQLCLSCHVGNTAEDRFVTHAMYAAGHPPLPGIEVATFSEEMPRHWENLSEKSKRLESLSTTLKDRFGISAEEVQSEHSRFVLLGGVASLRDSIELAVTQAQKVAEAPQAEARSLDLALFDCYACHHELKNPSWRAQRGYKGKPGRPQLQSWPTVLVRTALVSLKRSEAELDAALKPLYDVFDNRPFGDPVKVATQGKEVIAWLDALLIQLRESKWDRARMDGVLNYLADIKPTEIPDYESARLRAWAFFLIYGETRGLSYLDVKKIRQPLDQLIELAIPATRQQSLEKDLPNSLEKRNDYDPEKFKTEYRKLTQKLLAEKSKQ